MSKQVNRFLSIFSSEMVGFIVTVLLTPILVRYLGSSEYGNYAYVLSIFTILSIVIDAGVFDTTRKFVSETHHSSNWQGRVVSSLFLISNGIGIVLSATLLLGVQTGIVEDQLGAKFNVYTVFLAGWLFVHQLFKIGRATLMGLEAESISESSHIGNKLIFFASTVFLLQAGLGVEGVLLAHILPLLIISPFMYYMIVRRIDVSFSEFLSKAERTEIVSYASGNVVLVFLTFSLYNVDILLLRPFVGAEQTGYYKAALVIAGLVWFGPKILQMFLLHSTSNMWSEGDRGKIEELSQTLVRFTTLFSLLIVLGMAALAEPFVRLYYGANFIPTVVPLLLLLPGTLGFAISRPIYSIGQGKGDLRILIYATGAAAVLNLVLNLLFIPRYGMSGAAVATSVGYGSMVFLHIWSARKIGFDPIGNMRLIRILLTASLSAPVIFGLAQLISSDILALIVVPPLGFITYVVVAVRTRALDPEELRELFSQLPGPFNQMIS